MKRICLPCLVFSFLLFLNTIQLFSTEKQIISYLDSGDYEIANQRRVDYMLDYVFKAEQLALNTPDLSSNVRQRLEINFVSIFQKIKQRKQAIPHLKKWLEIEEENIEQVNLYTVNLGRLGYNYMILNQQDSALKYYQKALSFSRSIQHPLYESSSLNNLGLYYFNLKKYKKSKILFEEALLKFTSPLKKDSSLLISINDNLSDFYLIEGDTTQSIQLIRNNIIELQRFPNLFNKYILYSIKLFDLEKTRISSDSIQRLFYNLNKIKNGKRFNSIEFSIQKEILSRFINYASLNEKLSYLRYINRLNDSIIKKQSIEESILSENINGYILRVSEREKQNLINQSELKNQKNKNRLIVLGILLFFLLAVFIFSFIVYKSRIKITLAENKLKEQELKLQHLENEKLSEDLDLKKKDFSDLHMQIKLEEGFNDEIINQLKAIRSEKDEQKTGEINNLIRSLKQKSSIFEKLEVQKRGMDEANSSFFQKLDQRFPGLTKSERDLCGLIRLKLDGKEIAMIRNIQPASVRKLRFRLRKKMALDQTVDIYDFISKI